MNLIFTDIEFPKKKRSMCLKHREKIGQGKTVCEYAIGQTQSGRYLRVIYVPESDGAFCNHRIRIDR